MTVNTPTAECKSRPNTSHRHLRVCVYLVVPLVDLALGVNTEDGRVCCVDESLQLLLDSIVLISIRSNNWIEKYVQSRCRQEAQTKLIIRLKEEICFRGNKHHEYVKGTTGGGNEGGWDHE